MQTMLPGSRTCWRLLSVLLLSLTCFYSNAQASDHRVTINGTGITLKSVFKAIKEQTGFAVMYNTTITMLNQDDKVTVSFKNTPLDEVFTFLFKGKNLGWTYNDDVVVIHKKEVVTPAKKEADSTVTPAMLTGRVTDAAGSPLPGVTVQVKGTSQGTTTDADGKFTLAQVANEQTLVFSSVGFETRTMTVKGRTVLAELSVQVSALDETVVIAYGETTKRLSTGNIASVKAKDIAKQPISNPLLALQGRVPGLFIEQATGIPGSGIKVRIQGQNSLERGSDPLYVIDGVPYISQMLPGLTDIQGTSGEMGTSGNPLTYINPADIESIEILKDADATSIYGSRAAAGAILITTKKGKAGKLKVDVNFQKGWSKVGHFLDLLNTQQYLAMRMEAKKNDGESIHATDYDINGTWDTTRYTDWQKTLIGGSAQYTDAQLSVSGGTSNTTFLVGVGSHRETTVFPGDLRDQKISSHFNISHTSSDQRFKLQVGGLYMVDNNKLISTNLADAAIRLAPNAPALYNKDGSLNWAVDASGTSTWNNPLAHLLTSYRNQVDNLTGNAIIAYELLPGVNIKTNFGYTNMSRNEVTLFPLIYNAPENRPWVSRFSNFSNDLITSWTIEPQVTFRKDLYKGSLEILIGSTFLKNLSNQQRVSAQGFTSDLLLEDITAASTLRATGSMAALYKYSALFSRLNYNWQNKYITNFNIRRDGSSRFGSRNMLHNFWSVGAAWILSNEPFVKKTLPFLSFAKLRASYGTTGNDQIGDYQFMNLYFPRNLALPYQGITGLYTADFPNPYLQWEETRKLQIGLETSFAHDRLFFNLTYYRNRSSNQLQSYALPIITGSNTITTNFQATIQNSGFEFACTSTNIKSENISWNSSINFTIPKNKLIAYENLALSSYANRYIIGQPFTIYHLYRAAGIDPATGVYMFSDSHGTFTSNPVYPEDAMILFNTEPKYYGGFQNTLNFKTFSLDFLFQFVGQKAVSYRFGNMPGRFRRGYGNQPIIVLDRWQKAGDIRSVQKYSTTYPDDVLLPYIYAAQSDEAYQDANYIRLKNASFSWQLPDALIRKVHLQYARVFAQGQNLLTFTRYTGLDPESKSNISTPPLRTWTLGIQVTL